jgi:hypothetical protein
MAQRDGGCSPEGLRYESTSAALKAALQQRVPGANLRPPATQIQHAIFVGPQELA